MRASNSFLLIYGGLGVIFLSRARHFSNSMLHVDQLVGLIYNVTRWGAFTIFLPEPQNGTRQTQTHRCERIIFYRSVPVEKRPI